MRMHNCWNCKLMAIEGDGISYLPSPTTAIGMDTVLILIPAGKKYGIVLKFPIFNRNFHNSTSINYQNFRIMGLGEEDNSFRIQILFLYIKFCMSLFMQKFIKKSASKGEESKEGDDEEEEGRFREYVGGA